MARAKHLKIAFDLVMVRPSVKHFGVQIRARVIHEASEEILQQLGLQIAHQPRPSPDPYKPAPAGRPDPRATTASVSSMGSTK